MDPEDLIQRFMDPGFPYTYKECNRQGHDWAEREVEWFPYRWRLPWFRQAMFIMCQGCGIHQLVPGARAWVWPKFRE